MSNLDRLVWLAGIGAIILAVVYRSEIEWAYKNRATLAQGQSVVDEFNAVKGAF